MFSKQDTKLNSQNKTNNLFSGMSLFNTDITKTGLIGEKSNDKKETSPQQFISNPFQRNNSNQNKQATSLFGLTSFSQSQSKLFGQQKAVQQKRTNQQESTTKVNIFSLNSSNPFTTPSNLFSKQNMLNNQQSNDTKQSHESKTTNNIFSSNKPSNIFDIKPKNTQQKQVFSEQNKSPKQQQASSNQKINNFNQFSSPNIVLQDRDQEQMLDDLMQQIKQPEKRFKRDSLHLVNIDDSYSQSQITEHLQLKNKPKQRDSSFVKVVSNNNDIEDQLTNSKITIVNTKQDIIQSLTQYFKNSQQGLQFDLSQLGSKLQQKDIVNMRNKMQNHLSINSKYIQKQQQLKKQIQGIKKLIVQVQNKGISYEQIKFKQVQRNTELNISNMWQQILKYKSILALDKLQQIKVLNQKYLQIKSRNKQLTNSKNNIINHKISPIVSSNQQKVKSVEQIKYEKAKQSLISEIKLERQKYDKLKTIRKSSVDLERLSSLTGSQASFDVRIRQQHTTSKNLLVLVLFSLVLAVVLVYGYLL